MDKILCLKFNNLYNKRVKNVKNIADYYTYAEKWKFLNLTNFLPGDGIHTSDNWNWNEDWFPDYICRYNADDNFNVTVGNLDEMDDVTVYTTAGTSESYWIKDEDCPYINYVTKEVDFTTWTRKLEYQALGEINKIVFTNPASKLEDLYFTATNVVKYTSFTFYDDQGNILDFVINNGSFDKVTITGADVLELAQHSKVDWNENTFIEKLEIYEFENLEGLLFHVPSKIQFINLSNPVQPIDRWYVVHTERNRQGQYKFQFYRDLIADNFDDVLDQTAFIERGYVPPTSDLIFNKEGFSFNQIKVGETALMDDTQTPWIVGYLPFDLDNTSGDFDIQEGTDILATYDYPSYEWGYLGETQSVTNVLNWGYWMFTQKSANANRFRRIGWDFVNKKWYGTSIDKGKRGLFLMTYGNVNLTSGKLSNYPWFEALGNVNMSNWFYESQLISKLNTQFGGYSASTLQSLLSWNGKSIRFSDGVYKVKVEITNDKQDVYHIKSLSNTDTDEFVWKTIESHLKELHDLDAIGIQTNNGIEGHIDYIAVTVKTTLTPDPEYVADSSYHWTIPKDSRPLRDNPYKMFAIPLSGVSMNFSGEILNTNEEINLKAAIDITRTLVTNQQIYDLQILPYCPIVDIYRDGDGILRMPATLEYGIDYTYITYGDGTDESDKRSVIIYPEQSSFSFNIEQPITVSDIKLENETTFYRLCSPNYSAAFDFNVAMNRGIKYWNVYCTYKPYSPYIQVSPMFDGLYGGNFKDYRGLVCAGDFSLPLVDDAWTTYELNNKNYQNMFDRQVQNMEVMHDIEMYQANWNVATGGIQGATSGAMTGAIAGGGVGAIVGGAVGGVASVAGGIADLEVLKRKHAENMSYANDVYLMQLANIQALPTTLSRISSLTAIFKFYPVIEKYTCTDVEKQAFKDFIKYNGMTVNVIGKIRDYITNEYPYIKCQLIRTDEESAVDYHELVEIAGILAEGVYLENEYTE